ELVPGPALGRRSAVERGVPPLRDPLCPDPMGSAGRGVTAPTRSAADKKNGPSPAQGAVRTCTVPDQLVGISAKSASKTFLALPVCLSPLAASRLSGEPTVASATMPIA